MWAPKVSFISFVILETILRVVHQFISVAFRDSHLNSYDITACAGEGGDEGGNEVVVGGDMPLEWFASVTYRV